MRNSKWVLKFGVFRSAETPSHIPKGALTHHLKGGGTARFQRQTFALLAEGAPAKKGGRGVASVLRSKTAERVQPNCRNKILQSIVANAK